MDRWTPGQVNAPRKSKHGRHRGVLHPGQKRAGASKEIREETHSKGAVADVLQVAPEIGRGNWP